MIDPSAEDRFVTGSDDAPPASALANDVRRLGDRLRLPLEVVGLHGDMVETVVDQLGPESVHRQRLSIGLTDLRKELERVTTVIECFQQYVEVSQMQRELIDLEAVIENALGTPPPAEVDVIVEESVPQISADPEHLAAAIAELIQNAQSAAPPGTFVSVHAFAGNGQLIIDVNDAGDGVLVEPQERVFELFFSTREGRAGIGLSLARRVARLHGGELELLSSQGGPGTSFRLSLPL